MKEIPPVDQPGAPRPKPHRFESVAAEYGPWKEPRGVRWKGSTDFSGGACRDWSRPSREVRWSRATPGPAGKSWSLCGHDEPPARPTGTVVGVLAGRRVSRRSERRRFHRRDEAGSTDRG